MARGARSGPSQQTDQNTQAARGGPQRIGYPTYAEIALRLFDNGYEPLPIRAGEKRPAVTRWSDVTIDQAQMERWGRYYPNCGIGLRTGHLVGVDIDVLDQDLAHQMGQIVEQRLGGTLMRVGLWPKRLYLYRTAMPFAKLAVRRLEILGRGQQFVAFGMHPVTRKPYYWPGGESPLDVPFAELPLVNEATFADVLGELASLQPEIGAAQHRRRGAAAGGGLSNAPVRNADGLVTDGRDGWLSSLAYHAVHDAVEAGAAPDAEVLADRVWQKFTATTDFTRPKQGSGEPYTWHDGLRKVQDKLGLLDAGRLPPRALPVAEPVSVDTGMPVEEARATLASAIADFCTRAELWHRSDRSSPAPRVGVRATVGLGKTAVSRLHLLRLQAKLKQAGLPHRILVFTPSLALADESAAEWTQDGICVAVHRGYEAKAPGRDVGMCRDIDMVHIATASGQSVFPNACMRRTGSRCHNFDACAKQDNFREVVRADVVLAAYDSLFTGLSIKAEEVALIVIDEGCWERAIKRTTVNMGDITRLDAVDQPRMDNPAAEEVAWTDLYELRKQAVAALQANGTGVLSRRHLVAAGLTADTCAKAAALEGLLRADPGLHPGLPQGARKQAAKLSKVANLSVRREQMFLAFEHLLNGPAEQDGRVTILASDAITGAQSILITGLHKVQDQLLDLPVLHLDATLRPELAATVLPHLEVTEITAAMPHLHLTAVQGHFAKSTLVADAKADPAENQRRANRLRECVDYVRWHAKRVRAGRTLVVTYKDIEPAFAAIPGVVTGHFKAIAGLDVFKDVALLVVIGRPMPSDHDMAQLSGAYFGHVPTGGYRYVRRGLLMRNGSRRGFAVRQHEDVRAEVLRAAICDDEVIQAIGRARGVNRTSANPVEVHLLADVALPLVHDRVTSWDMVYPDLFQRMLLSGLAVDSPADAAILHADILGNAEQAKKAFQRGLIGGHFPIDNTYREMSLKSASYRRGGRGRSWQRVWWIDGEPSDLRSRLEESLGPLAGWEPV